MKPINTSRPTKAEQTGPRHWYAASTIFPNRRSSLIKCKGNSARSLGNERGRSTPFLQNHGCLIRVRRGWVYGLPTSRVQDSPSFQGARIPEFLADHFTTPLRFRFEEKAFLCWWKRIRVALPKSRETMTSRDTMEEPAAKAQASLLDLYDPDQINPVFKEWIHDLQRRGSRCLEGLRQKIASSKGKPCWRPGREIIIANEIRA